MNINLQSMHHFIARGDAFRGNTSLPVTITGNYSSFGPDPVQCTVVPDTENLPSGSSNLFDDQHTIQLRGKTELEKEIWIPRFRVTSTTHAGDQVSWKGIAEFFAEGNLDEFDASGGTIICSAFVPPTPIALSDCYYVPSYDGTIALECGERKGIRWNTSLGEAELIDNYEYHRDEKVGLDQAMIRVQRCQITIEIQPAGVVSLRTILSDLEDALNEALWLSSFLSRRRIAWYGAEAIFFPGDGLTKDVRQAIARRRQWLGFKSETQTDPSWMIDLLVKKQALKDGLFQQLLVNYETLPFHNTIRRAIINLLMSYERGYLEAQLGNVYAALEGLVDGLDQDVGVTYLLGSARFKRLSKKLRQFIRDEIEEQDIAEGIIKKLPELRRRAFWDRLLLLLEKYDLDVTKLWPPGADIPSELQKLIKRRDIYIHQGKMDDLNLYLFDFNRVQNLVELWILKLLNCPESAINPHALGCLVPINRP
jgi:hypothetical protein